MAQSSLVLHVEANDFGGLLLKVAVALNVGLQMNDKTIVYPPPADAVADAAARVSPQSGLAQVDTSGAKARPQPQPQPQPYTPLDPATVARISAETEAATHWSLGPNGEAMRDGKQIGTELGEKFIFLGKLVTMVRKSDKACLLLKNDDSWVNMGVRTPIAPTGLSATTTVTIDQASAGGTTLTGKGLLLINDPHPDWWTCSFTPDNHMQLTESHGSGKAFIIDGYARYCFPIGPDFSATVV